MYESVYEYIHVHYYFEIKMLRYLIVLNITFHKQILSFFFLSIVLVWMNDVKHELQISSLGSEKERKTDHTDISVDVDS